MKVITGPRAAGKTYEAAKIAKETGAYLVVNSMDEASRINNAAGFFPVTYEELLSNKMVGSRVRKIVIDNLDIFVRSMFPHLEIEAVTISEPIHRLTLEDNPHISDEVKANIRAFTQHG